MGWLRVRLSEPPSRVCAPVDPAHAAVLQSAVCEQPAARAARAAEALLMTGTP